ncbi:mannose-1-phosphate guanyltransferase alpha-like [Schistocerca gregaria]|uniref:mannose-1-phosphate guanyltransferase alpha-like n=1 Tax=Schistocerca gregaria TaxID=7010 RepID=UPI00211E76B0|nr:mannose-1-phosphate guanyltransferase alpha-like [Schistocerca gregaria]
MCFKIVVIIFVGGPTYCTQFRPLSFDLPKPLFPIANKQLVRHHIEACKEGLGTRLSRIVLVGAYSPSDFKDLISGCALDLDIHIEYFKEELLVGTAAVLLELGSRAPAEDVSHFVLIDSDVCCAIPLREMLEFHLGHGRGVTLMGKRVSSDEAANYNCYTVLGSEVVGYFERPEMFVSDVIDARVYIFSDAALRVAMSFDVFKGGNVPVADGGEEERASLELHMLPGLIDRGMVSTYECGGFWMVLKRAGEAMKGNRLWLELYERERSRELSRASNYLDPVMVDSTARVDPTSKIGPNVCIGPNCVVEAGARVANSILLANCKIGRCACVLYSILSEGCSVGEWAHVRGTGRLEEEKEHITILGHSVKVEPEVVIQNCIVMPQKRLRWSYFDEVIL